ncbi:MATE family efflux transporter [Shewanella baltica]|uniref:MATE efflux family protein n=1 Tax=Shewanella baltica (strain OS155 / ATCC BAA-1091) TaxID=325240 RepID=A3D5K6_SHEB5|nr:MATE family efflux transporter [Shewanella baltica]ABN62019.1 MATE efflux family protein [Shewanella baltica OS155]AEH14369.1 MATE efflux family protein [Shewanella baltica OS117]MCS6161478.1 MATE family efflux transporter [Shewanella baltica]
MTQAKFVEGPILRHILVMSSTAAVGISALFVVDLLDIFFLSLLGEHELAAAVGYAGSISFFTTSIGIGLSIALGALVSRSIGAKDVVLAKRLLLNSAVVTTLISVLVAAVVTTFIPELVALVGASGHTAELAASYLYILVPSLPFICLAMALGGALRAVGDAKLSMMSTLAGGGVNAVLDPIFIFMFAMGIEGAALASVLARVAVFVIAGRGVVVKHKLLGHFDKAHFVADLKPIFAIAGPAMLTNVATPIGNAFVTRAIADFGDAYVAGWAVLGRLIPVTFGMIFALSGAIGPIVGQNFGAGQFDRVRESLTRAIQFCTVYVLVMSLLLFVLKSHLVNVFDMKGDSADLIHFFCSYIAVFFIFSGILFVANASFNNLGKAKYSTLFNVGKATLGTVPFVYFGALWGGVYGVLIGQILGSILFGTLGVWVAYRLVDKVAVQAQFSAMANVGGVNAVPCNVALTEEEEIANCVAENLPSATNPLSSSCVQMAQLTEEQESESVLPITYLEEGKKPN